MSGRLAGRTALVTGATRGIGLGIAQAYAREGAALCLAATSEERLAEAKRRLDPFGVRVETVALDVSDREACFDLVRRVGSVPQPDLEMTLNCGVGMVALTHPDDADAAVAVLAEHGVRAWVAGEVTAAADRGGAVELVNQHPGW